MRRISALLLLPFGLGLSQTPAAADLFTKAPPQVDEALRARVTQFNQLHIEGKFRQAEKLVAEESQDVFYNMEKRTYKSCEVIRITYVESFTAASVTQACKGDWNIQGQMMSVSMPMTTTWKLLSGNWFWSHIPPKQQPTPFGGMAHQNETNSQPQKVELPKDIKAAGEAILGRVSIDKQEVMLSSYETKEEIVTITNALSGQVQVRADIDTGVPGFTATLDRAVINGGDKAVLKLRIEPKDKAPKSFTTVRVSIEPLGRVFPIKVGFAIPPDVQKEIQKATGPRQPQ